MSARVVVVMGSRSDLDTMKDACSVLKAFSIPYEVRALSAHRTPDAVRRYISQLAERGVKVVIAGAGGAAHLAGVCAAHTHLPVIGVPLSSSSLSGLDALLSTVQMPRGVPVATTAIGSAGAHNAALLAVQMLALADPELTTRLKAHKDAERARVEDASIITEA